MQTVDAAHWAVDLADCSAIAGAIAADIDSRQVCVVRRAADGQEAQQLVHVPAGIRIVRRR